MKHKSDEIFARNHIGLFLEEKYPGYEIDESIIDDPDYVFEYESKRIGIEFAHITIEKLMEWAAHKQFSELKHDVRYILTIPIEPHMWIQRSISDKNTLFDKYMVNSNLDECWLLLHQGDNSRRWFIPEDKNILSVLQIYASNLPTKFRKILYLHQDHDVVELKTKIKEGTANVVASVPLTQQGWRAQEINLVRTTLKGETTINIDDVPIEQHFFIPYLETGVEHGDPRSKA
jgi:hypothetical protein